MDYDSKKEEARDVFVDSIKVDVDNIQEGRIKQEDIDTEENNIEQEFEESSIEKEIIELGSFKLTYYHPGDNYKSGNITGSGKSISDFDIIIINGSRAYTYQGKLVFAAATEELLKAGYGNKQEGKHYFRYKDEIRANINGVWYDAIILDSCGASMWEGEKRLDIYTPSAADRFSGQIEVEYITDKEIEKDEGERGET